MCQYSRQYRNIFQIQQKLKKLEILCLDYDRLILGFLEFIFSKRPQKKLKFVGYDYYNNNYNNMLLSLVSE